ncbi:MAG: DcaP family trimeric outer membrane transporter [bacterium]
MKKLLVAIAVFLLFFALTAEETVKKDSVGEGNQAELKGEEQLEKESGQTEEAQSEDEEDEEDEAEEDEEGEAAEDEEEDEAEAEGEAETEEEKTGESEKQQLDAQKIEALEKSIEELKKEVSALKSQSEKPKDEKKKTAKKEEKKVIFKPYGTIELYGYGTDALFTHNDLILYTKDEKGTTSNISARSTRLGLDVTVPYITAVDLSAKAEIDFLGGLAKSGMAESNVGIRMRHAYLKLSKTFKTDTTIAFLAGQTWATAVIPIFPNLINPSAGWGKGNLWSRLPIAEFELSQKVKTVDMGLKISVAKPVTGASANSGNFLELNLDAGDSSNWPSIQSQIYLKAKFAGIDLFWGAGGAYGRENYVDGIKINNSETPVFGDEVDVWMFNTALKLSHKYAEIQGKYFMGANLDSFGFFGGSLIKDVEGYVVESLKAQGYWAELTIKPYKGLRFSVGLSGEYTNHDQSVFDQNDAFWVSAFWTFFDHLTPGFEWEQVVTEKDGVKKTGNAFFGSVKFTF